MAQKVQVFFSKRGIRAISGRTENLTYKRIKILLILDYLFSRIRFMLDI